MMVMLGMPRDLPWSTLSAAECRTDIPILDSYRIAGSFG